MYLVDFEKYTCMLLICLSPVILLSSDPCQMSYLRNANFALSILGVYTHITCSVARVGPQAGQIEHDVHL